MDEDGEAKVVVVQPPSKVDKLPDAYLTFWLKLEVLMFCANIIANVVFLLLRSCSRNRIELTLNEDEAQESEDAVEKQ